MNPLPPLIFLAAVTWLVAIALPVLDWWSEWRVFADPSHCEWCGIELARWRVLLLRAYCSVCSPLIRGDAGIYCQTGGPPCSRDARRGQTERGRGGRKG